MIQWGSINVQCKLMRKTIAIFFILIKAVDTSAGRYNPKDFGRSVSEIYVIKNHKDELAILMGKDKISRGILALQANDLANAIKLERKNKNKVPEKINNTESFVITRVANDVITNVDVINAIRFIFFSSGKPYDEKYARMMIKPVLDSLIDDKVRQRLATLNKMNVSSEVTKKIESIAQDNKMTVSELETAFRKAGIDMVIFKQNIASKLVFSAFYQSVEQMVNTSPSIIKDEKKQYENDIKYERYKLSEIFFRSDSIEQQKSVREKAEAVMKLLNDGFNFDSLVDSISQTDVANKISEKEWIRVDKLDKSILSAVEKLVPGEHSGIIQVHGGYKIVKVVDKANPNKEGTSKAKYKVVVATIPMPEIKTQDEAISFQMSLATLAEADSVEKFKRACKVYEFTSMDVELSNPTPLQMELIKRNKSSGRTGIIRIAENQPFVALFVVSEYVPSATIPDDKALTNIFINRKSAQAFSKLMKRQRTMNYETVYKGNLEEIVGAK